MYQLAVSRLFAIMPRIQTRKCQRYSPKWLSTLSMIWQIITDFLKLLSDKKKIKKINALLFISYCLSLKLGCVFPSQRYQSRCHRRLPNLNVPYFECHWMHVQLRHIYVSLKPEAIKILKLCVFLIVVFLLGLLHLDFNQVLRHEQTVCPVYLPLFHSQYASHGHLLEEWF